MSTTSSAGMSAPFFHEFKKQASFFLREKIKNARLALTDVTPAELMTEEATGGNPWAPDAKSMSFISRAAFEIDDFWRIVQILHKRLAKFDRKHWREPYNALVILEHLLTHGPESVADEFQCDGEIIQELGSFQFIDERGFNWGLAVRKKSERVMKLLEKGPVLKQERDQARRVTRGIQGFGSFNLRWSQGSKDSVESSVDQYGRWNSHYEAYTHDDDDDDDAVVHNMNQTFDFDSVNIDQMKKKKALIAEEEETEELDEPKVELQKEEHPFDSQEHQRMESMLLLSQS